MARPAPAARRQTRARPCSSPDPPRPSFRSISAPRLGESGLASWRVGGEGEAPAEGIVAALSAVPEWSDRAVERALMEARASPTEAPADGPDSVPAAADTGVWSHGRELEHCFASPCADEAARRLRAAIAAPGAGAEWARPLLAALEAGCPAAQACAVALVSEAWRDSREGIGSAAEGDDAPAETAAGEGDEGREGHRYPARLRRALDQEYALNARLGLRADFIEGVECAIGPRRGESPRWRPTTVAAVREEPWFTAAMAEAGLRARPEMCDE